MSGFIFSYQVAVELIEGKNDLFFGFGFGNCVENRMLSNQLPLSRWPQQVAKASPGLRLFGTEGQRIFFLLWFRKQGQQPNVSEFATR